MSIIEILRKKYIHILELSDFQEFSSFTKSKKDNFSVKNLVCALDRNLINEWNSKNSLIIICWWSTTLSISSDNKNNKQLISFLRVCFKWSVKERNIAENPKKLIRFIFRVCVCWPECHSTLLCVFSLT